MNAWKIYAENFQVNRLTREHRRGMEDKKNYEDYSLVAPYGMLFGSGGKKNSVALVR
jgi:hypothetical protein